MKKVLVEFEVPAVGKTFDAYVPTKLPLHQLLPIVSRAVAELTEGQFVPVRETLFCDKQSGAVFDINMSAEELCLHNGSCLMII